jgi:hypothetical protein
MSPDEVKAVGMWSASPGRDRDSLELRNVLSSTRFRRTKHKSSPVPSPQDLPRCDKALNRLRAVQGGLWVVCRQTLHCDYFQLARDAGSLEVVPASRHGTPRCLRSTKASSRSANVPETMIHNLTSSKKARAQSGSITGKQLFVDSGQRSPSRAVRAEDGHTAPNRCPCFLLLCPGYP